MAAKAGESQNGALEAINEALGLAGDEAHIEETDEELEGGDGTEGDIDGDGEGTIEGKGDEDGDVEGEEEGEGDTRTEEEKVAAAKAAGKSGERNADGTFKKPEGEAKKADPINDPIPKDLKKETSDRMQSLIKIAKDVSAERDNYRTNFDTIINGIKATGSSPEQYGEAISWLSLFNKGPGTQDYQQAYTLLEGVVDRMATLQGIDRTVKDPLAAHLDLKAAVTAGKTTPEFAREIARIRDARAFNGQIQQTQHQQQQTQAQAAQELAQGRADLNAFEEQMKSDPLYNQKKAMIVPALRESFKHIAPSKWAATFKAAYANAKVVPRGRTTTSAINQPMRGGKNPAGGQARVAGSAVDAMSAAISSMNK